MIVFSKLWFLNSEFHKSHNLNRSQILSNYLSFFHNFTKFGQNGFEGGIIWGGKELSEGRCLGHRGKAIGQCFQKLNAHLEISPYPVNARHIRWKAQKTGEPCSLLAPFHLVGYLDRQA